MLYSFGTMTLSALLITFPLMAAQASDQDQLQTAATPADQAFEKLSRAVGNLHQSFVNKGGIAADDHGVIRTMRERAAAFSQQFPNDARGPKLELMLSKWLKDEAAVASHFARILRLEPDNQAARMSWAQQLRSENRYTEALAVMDAHPPDPEAAPSDAFAYADVLFAEHQFDRALAVLDSIPTEAMDERQKTAFQENKIRYREYVSLWPQEESLRAQEDAADDLPRAIIVTSRGPITFDLFENQAPNTVANFISLAEQGFYNGTKFHRVIPNFMAQGGDPNSKEGATGAPGLGDPGYFIPDEIDRDDHRKHFTGSLAMAKTDAPNSGGCQFYITVAPTPHLNGKHTVFGTVIHGIDIVRAIKQDDVVEMVTVIRKRQHDYTPQTLPKGVTATITPSIPVPTQPDTEPQTEPQPEPQADEEPPAPDSSDAGGDDSTLDE